MTGDEDTQQFFLRNLNEQRSRGQTDTRLDAPTRAVDAAFWDSARVVMPPPGKASVHMRLDTDVLDWFRAQGRGHLTRMNAVLRSFMEAQKKQL